MSAVWEITSPILSIWKEAMRGLWLTKLYPCDMGNRGFVGLYTAEGLLLVTLTGFIVLAMIVAGALYMRRAMHRETQLRKEMKDRIRPKSQE